MKKILSVIFALTFTYPVLSQNSNDYNESILEKGYPLVLKQFFDFYGQYKQSEVKTAILQTGIDSLQVYFGTARKDDGTDRKFYWSAITNYDSLLTLSAGFLLPKDPTGLLSNKVELTLGENSPHRVVYDAKFNPDKDAIKYRWTDGKSTNNTRASILTNENFKLGNSFPDLNFNLLSDRKVNSKDLKGKIIVVNWWNTGCRPCIAEMPGLNALADEYSKNKNILFIAVAHNTKDEVADFLKNRSFKYQQSVFNKISLDYFGNEYPKHLIINKYGKISYYGNGGGPKVHHEIKKALDKTIKL